MKQYFYPTVMMLAMMVAALSFTACGGDDDDNLNPKENPTDNGNGGTSDSSLSLTLDGNKLYADASYASILALKDGATGIPSTATYNDTESIYIRLLLFSLCHIKCWNRINPMFFRNMEGGKWYIS